MNFNLWLLIYDFLGKTKYVQETVEYDDDATQADSPPSQKRPKVGGEPITYFSYLVLKLLVHLL